MARVRAVYTCRECGAQQPKWAGQCAGCGQWNTLEEGLPPRARRGQSRGEVPAAVTTLGAVRATPPQRLGTGVGELDRVLGGGAVPGSVVLIGGDPGIGKSTLLLQAAAALSERVVTLYVTGEESVSQIALRGRRIAADGDQLQLVAENRIEPVLAAAQAARAQVLVADSIQTLYTEDLPSAPGSVSQVRETAARLVRYAKESGAIAFLIGHVTKEGALAGPRVLEHMVDTVLYFEGDAGSRFRILRAVKNRFGAVNELGVFAMAEDGLREVVNPSAMFVNRKRAPVAGTAVLATHEGTRPLLAAVQALVDPSPLANPRRLAVGLHGSRLALLLAVLHRHAGLAIHDQDMFVNVVSGLRVTEPAADLAVVAAAVSSLRDAPLGAELVVFGEVGLTGEVRPVPYGEERVREAAKLGFKRALVPAANRPRKAVPGMQVDGVSSIGEVIEALF